MKKLADVENWDAKAVNAEFLGIWPGRMTDADEETWARFPLSRKRLALLRLAAIMGFKRREDGYSSAREAAAVANVSVPSFYRIAKRWKESPEIASLGLHATSDGPLIAGQAERRNMMSDKVRKALQERPDISISRLSALIGEETGRAPAFWTTKRLVQDVQRTMPPKSPFGDRIVMDSAGLDLVDPEGLATRLFAVVDVGTGIVLGWNVARATDAATGYKQAAQEVLDRHPLMETPNGILGKGLVGVVSCTPESIEMRLPPHAPEHVPLANFEIVHDDYAGRALLDALGERLGGVWIGSGTRRKNVSYKSNRHSSMPTVGETILDAIGDDIEAHNEARLQLAPRQDDRTAELEALGGLLHLLQSVVAAR